MAESKTECAADNVGGRCVGARGRLGVIASICDDGCRLLVAAYKAFVEMVIDTWAIPAIGYMWESSSPFHFPLCI